MDSIAPTVELVNGGLIPGDLYWSEDGSVACGQHAPYRGSDTWRSGRWTRMTADDQTMWRTANPTPPACETCDSMARIAARRRP